MSGADGAAPTDYTLANQCKQAYNNNADASWQAAINLLGQKAFSDNLNVKTNDDLRLSPLECASAKYNSKNYNVLDSAKKKEFLEMLLQNQNLDLNVQDKMLTVCAAGIIAYCEEDIKFKRNVVTLRKHKGGNSNLLERVGQMQPYPSFFEDAFKENIYDIDTDDDDMETNSSFIDHCSARKGQLSVYVKRC